MPRFFCFLSLLAFTNSWFWAVFYPVVKLRLSCSWTALYCRGVSMFYSLGFPRLLLCLASCMAGATALAADPVLVDGLGVAITASDVTADAQRMPLEARRANLARPETVGRIGANLHFGRVLATYAERDGLVADPAVAAALKIARDKVLADAWLARLDAANTPTDAALDALAATYYKANPKRFDMPEQVRARHILIPPGPDARDQAAKLLAELKNGADFATLAKENSSDKGSAIKGGDLGFFERGRMVPEFAEAVFALKQPGDLTGVVETKFGLHIIRLEDKRPAGIRDFEDVRETLRREIVAKSINDARQQERSRVTDASQQHQAAIEAFAAMPR